MRRRRRRCRSLELRAATCPRQRCRSRRPARPASPRLVRAARRRAQVARPMRRRRAGVRRGNREDADDRCGPRACERLRRLGVVARTLLSQRRGRGGRGAAQAAPAAPERRPPTRVAPTPRRRRAAASDKAVLGVGAAHARAAQIGRPLVRPRQAGQPARLGRGGGGGARQQSSPRPSASTLLNEIGLGTPPKSPRL